LEVFENIPIDAKRDQLFGIRDGWLPRHGLQRLRGRLLECRFRCLPRVHGSSYSIVSHFDHPVDREVSEQFSYAGVTHSLMRSPRNVSTEMAINVLACNMKRVMALVGVSALAAMITP
jgi:hypothetical protein